VRNCIYGAQRAPGVLGVADRRRVAVRLDALVRQLEGTRRVGRAFHTGVGGVVGHWWDGVGWVRARGIVLSSCGRRGPRTAATGPGVP